MGIGSGPRPFTMVLWGVKAKLLDIRYRAGDDVYDKTPCGVCSAGYDVCLSALERMEKALFITAGMRLDSHPALFAIRTARTDAGVIEGLLWSNQLASCTVCMGL